jgi:hypothetical protein
LIENPTGQVQRPEEDALKLILAQNLPADFPDGAAEIGLKLRSALPARLNCLAWA